MNIDGEAMKSVVAKAIVDNLTPEARTELITKAVQNVLSAKESARYDSPVLIQAAFNDAVRDVARTIAAEMVKNDPEVKAKLEGIMRDAWAKVAGDEYNGVVDKIATAITKGLTGRDY